MSGLHIWIGSRITAQTHQFFTRLTHIGFVHTWPNDPAPKSRLAEVLMAQATGDGRFYAGQSYGEPEMSRLREAKTLLQESWSGIRQTDLAATSLHIVQISARYAQ